MCGSASYLYGKTAINRIPSKQYFTTLVKFIEDFWKPNFINIWPAYQFSTKYTVILTESSVTIYYLLLSVKNETIKILQNVIKLLRECLKNTKTLVFIPKIFWHTKFHSVSVQVGRSLSFSKNTYYLPKKHIYIYKFCAPGTNISEKILFCINYVVNLLKKYII